MKCKNNLIHYKLCLKHFQGASACAQSTSTCSTTLAVHSLKHFTVTVYLRLCMVHMKQPYVYTRKTKKNDIIYVPRGTYICIHKYNEIKSQYSHKL